MNEDDMLVQQFEACTFPFEEWRHRVHVKIAFLYAMRFDLEIAAKKLRDGIRAFNSANNVQDTPASGYHETMTMAWLRIIDATARAYKQEHLAADEFVDFHPQLREKKVLRLFYSPELFMSLRAKYEFVEPDLAPLPTAKLDDLTIAGPK
jgi:hypothetical protein